MPILYLVHVMNILTRKVKCSCENKSKQIYLINVFMCLDLDTGESRLLGLVMIPGRHIISIQTDVQQTNELSDNSSDLEQI